MSRLKEALQPLDGIRDQLFSVGARVRDAFERRPQRERMMILAMLGFFGVMTILLTAFLLISALDDLRAKNRSIEEALGLLAKNGDAYLKRRREEQRLDIKLSREAPPLQKFLDETATRLNEQLEDE